MKVEETVQERVFGDTEKNMVKALREAKGWKLWNCRVTSDYPRIYLLTFVRYQG